MGKSRSRSRSRDKKKHKDHKDRKERKRSYSRDKKSHKYDRNDKYDKLREKPSQNNDNQPSQAESTQAKVEKVWEKIKEEKQAEEEALLKVQQKYGFVPKKPERKGPEKLEGVSSYNPVMIEVIINDRLGKKERIKCLPSDTIGILKKLIQAKTGTRAEKIKLQKWHQVFKDHITLEDYEIHDGMSLEMYYN
ncbi:hypothetical protein ABPG74_021934 [Tetrahymena malaccensis]